MARLVFVERQLLESVKVRLKVLLAILPRVLAGLLESVPNGRVSALLIIEGRAFFFGFL